MTFRSLPLSSICLALAAFLLLAAVFGTAVAHVLLNDSVFGERTAAALNDPGVASFTAEKLTDAALAAKPDLIAARPVLVSVARGIVATRAFHSLMSTAAENAHRAVFAEGSRQLVLSLPDLQILLQSALRQASPDLAAKVPPNITGVVASLGSGKISESLVDLWRLSRGLLWLTGSLWFIAPILFALALWLAPDRQDFVVRAGSVLVVLGVLLLSILPAGRLALALALQNPLERGFLSGLLSSWFFEFNQWGLFLAGLGILLAAGASSLLETVDPVTHARACFSFLLRPPRLKSTRALWGLSLFVAGCVAIMFPRQVLTGIMLLTGLAAAYLGVRELFRLLLDGIDTAGPFREITQHSRWILHAGVVVLVAGLLGGAWFFFRSPSLRPENAAVSTCNGSASLCSKTLDQVVFPGAHNAMSNQQAAGWMFPHHQAGIPTQLAEGIRALLFDVHYGIPAGKAVKTEFGPGGLGEKVQKVVGEEGYQAALRIRNRLAGQEDGPRDLYLCHGMCELGAYRLVPTLTAIRDFLVQNPDEVVILIIEDYVSPADLAAAFDSGGLAEFVYRGPSTPSWPTLHTLITSRQRLVVFIESGRPGVPWLRPAFANFQETPYTFHKIDEFSCAPNRGGNSGSLFLMNNWIESTPTPKPSNAEIVNAPDFLLNRARRCAAERNHIPNIIAVDFYRSGSVVAAARELNR